MNLPPPVLEWVRAGGFGEVETTAPLGGGCIHTAIRLSSTSGAAFFLKLNPDVPPDMFPREAEGLKALADGQGPRVPKPLLWNTDFLLLEDLEHRRPAEGYWERLGRELAGLHGNVADRFGFDHDNYIGLTPQPNPWTADGPGFFREHRLGFQARLAHRAGLLPAADLQAVDALANRLEQLVPAAPACLLHGDLWSGNVMPGPQGEPCLVDPACHYGWAEAELGMTSLFGGFPATFYSAYQEASALEPGWRDRLPIYNLYHLLNHLNLFGQGYLDSVRSVLRRFA